jgi:multiple sugar transport system substrate-binding protein
MSEHDAREAISASQISQLTNAVTPSVQSLEPTNMSIPPIQFSQTIDAATSSSVSVVSSPSTGRFVLSDQPQLSKRRFSRRAILAGLTGIAGLTVVGGGITWLMHSHTSGNTHPTGMSGPINIVWQSECVATGVYAALVDNYNKTNRDGVHVTWRDGPVSTDDLLNFYENTLRTRSGDIDVMSIDVIYPALFASKGWTVTLNDKWPASDRADYLSGPIRSCTYNGKIVAAPIRTDLGLIYYRTDIIKTPPNTWNDLVNLSQSHASRTRYGYVWQGLQYEGLVCDFIEVLHGYGGSVLDPIDSKRVTINSSAGVQALTGMVNWVGTISPSSVIGFDEVLCHLAFLNGDAIFMRNWPYAYSLANDHAQSRIAGKFDIHAMLYGGNNTTGHSCVGGWNLAINAFSKHVDASWKFIQYMLGPYAQKQLALQATLTPALKSVYNDPEVQQKQPLFTKIFPILQTALPRPVSPVYQELSHMIQIRVHQALLKQVSPQDALNALQSDLQTLVSR